MFANWYAEINLFGFATFPPVSIRSMRMGVFTHTEVERKYTEVAARGTPFTSVETCFPKIYRGCRKYAEVVFFAKIYRGCSARDSIYFRGNKSPAIKFSLEAL